MDLKKKNYTYIQIDRQMKVQHLLLRNIRLKNTKVIH